MDTGQSDGHGGPASPGPRILVVDDERPIRRFLRAALVAEGYEVLEAGTAQEATALSVSGRPDVVILDLRLPDGDGLGVIHTLREWADMPIIVLSVRGGEADKIAALDAGADDYLTKPFGVGELLARLRVALRRSAVHDEEPVLDLGGLRVDLAHRTVTAHDREIHLTATEYALLRVLALHAGKVLTHGQLLHAVWGPGYESESHLLRVNISNLRHKIEIDPVRPRYVITEPGVGYRLRNDRND